MPNPSPTPINALDPVLIRRFMKQLTNIDVGANPQYANLIQTLESTGVMPVVPINTPANEVLQVYPRGWWGGGTVDSIGISGTAQIQTKVNVTVAGGKNGTSITAGTGLLLYTVTAGKTFYVSAITLSTAAAGGAQGIELRDGTTIAGGLKYSAYIAGNSTINTGMPNVPVAFTTGIFADVTATGAYFWDIVGWEE